MLETILLERFSATAGTGRHCSGNTIPSHRVQQLSQFPPSSEILFQKQYGGF